VWVKICGVRSVEAALHAQASGADAIGINLHMPSPRFVQPHLAAQIQAAISIPAYLVVVDRSPKELRGLIEEIQPAGIQFHGSTTEAEAMEIGHPFLKAYRGDSNCLAKLERSTATRVLLDAFLPSLHGGTGKRVDPSLARAACALKEVILAGGLNPENVAEIVRTLPIWGVDVASGVESQPGEQDPAQVAAFISAAKQARASAVE
jgi:phosphoribosylanthranilate isomerase